MKVFYQYRTNSFKTMYHFGISYAEYGEIREWTFDYKPAIFLVKADNFLKAREM